MPYLSIKSSNLSSSITPGVTVFTPIPLGAYLLVYTPTLNFLADYDGNTTVYPHRALAFDAMTLGNGMVRLFASQSSPSYLDFVHIRLLTEADFIPTDISGTPTAFRITRNILSFSSAQLNCIPQVYVATTPLSPDAYAFPVPLGVGILEAMQLINNGAVSVVLYYADTATTYAAFMTLTQVAIP